MLRFDRKQNSVKRLSFNQKISKLKKIVCAECRGYWLKKHSQTYFPKWFLRSEYLLLLTDICLTTSEQRVRKKKYTNTLSDW